MKLQSFMLDQTGQRSADGLIIETIDTYPSFKQCGNKILIFQR